MYVCKAGFFHARTKPKNLSSVVLYNFEPEKKIIILTI